jgi:hypothetical protein
MPESGVDEVLQPLAEPPLEHVGFRADLVQANAEDSVQEGLQQLEASYDRQRVVHGGTPFKS